MSVEVKIERNPQNKFTTHLPNSGFVGFHATSSLACSDIESVGFLPNKVFTRAEHDQIISEARLLGIGTWSYEEWLGMRSVTFAKTCEIALSHILQGNSGGQGLGNISNVLSQIGKVGNNAQRSMATHYSKKIEAIRCSGSVVYAVELSNLGVRLVQDKNQECLFQVYFDPTAPLPERSIVDPSYIVARLDIT